jgi:hypothetical protein
MKSRLIVSFLGIVWGLMTAMGLGVMLAYEETPGLAATPSVQWPANSRIQPSTDHATLVMLAHPQCPCTRASIGELNALMARCQNKVKVFVLFLKPEGFDKDWEKTDLWRSAAAIPGVTVLSDEGGLEANLFHVSTSGQTLLFSPSGQLLFEGGITGGRGHSGDNQGRDAIVSLVLTGKAEQRKTPVYGCSLRNPISNDEKGSDAIP